MVPSWPQLWRGTGSDWPELGASAVPRRGAAHASDTRPAGRPALIWGSTAVTAIVWGLPDAGRGHAVVSRRLRT